MKPQPLFRVRMDDDAATRVAEVLDSGYIGEGPQVAAFEAVLREGLQHPYVYAVNAGTSALWLAYHLVLSNLEQNRFAWPTFLCTPLTCLATNFPIFHQRAAIGWIDVDPNTGGMSPEKLAAWLVMKTARDVAGVVVCDWGGDPGALLDIRRLCDEHGVALIEDAAHAFGATVEGKLTGSIATMTAFSFQAIKLLTTGDGGALATLHAHDGERARLLRWFGLDRKKSESMRCYQQVPEPGFKFQMNDIAAAIGLANMSGVDGVLAAHREHAAYYDVVFSESGGAIRPLRRQLGSACWLYSVRVKDARDFIAKMGARGIECSQVHARNDSQRIFQRFRTALPGMDVLEREMVCLPVGWWMSRDDLWQVAHAALEVAGEQKAA